MIVYMVYAVIQAICMLRVCQFYQDQEFDRPAQAVLLTLSIIAAPAITVCAIWHVISMALLVVFRRIVKLD